MWRQPTQSLPNRGRKEEIRSDDSGAVKPNSLLRDIGRAQDEELGGEKPCKMRNRPLQQASRRLCNHGACHAALASAWGQGARPANRECETMSCTGTKMIKMAFSKIKDVLKSASITLLSLRFTAPIPT